MMGYQVLFYPHRKDLVKCPYPKNQFDAPKQSDLWHRVVTEQQTQDLLHK